MNLTKFGGAAKTICVNETQMAAIPPGWVKNATDTYSTTNCLVGIEELTTTNINKKVVHIYNLMGQEVSINDGLEGVFIFYYNDGTTEKRVLLQQQ